MPKAVTVPGDQRKYAGTGFPRARVSPKWIARLISSTSQLNLFPGVVTVPLVEVFLYSFCYLPYLVNLHSSHNLSRGTSTKLQSYRGYGHPNAVFN